VATAAVCGRACEHVPSLPTWLLRFRQYRCTLSRLEARGNTKQPQQVCPGGGIGRRTRFRECKLSFNFKRLYLFPLAHARHIPVGDPDAPACRNPDERSDPSISCANASSDIRKPCRRGTPAPSMPRMKNGLQALPRGSPRKPPFVSMGYGHVDHVKTERLQGQCALADVYGIHIQSIG